jgi:hypothetical protein
MHHSSNKLNEPDLKTLDGLKVLNFLWLAVLLSLLSLQDFGLSPFQMIEMIKLNKSLWIIVTSSHICIDFFYMLSAFFVTHNVLKISREFNGIGFGSFF